MMELAISAVTSELASRFISFLTNRYSGPGRGWSEEERLERLQQLLLRVGTVIEEADERYMANSGMHKQLKMLADAMYRGYWALGACRYRSLKEDEGEVSNSSPVKRSRIIHGGLARNHEGRYILDLQGALESLEAAVANMTEFVVLLGGCDRMLRRPYDTYLDTDNCLFSRHAEKQRLLSFLLNHDPPTAAPPVLPIIGGLAVGKRTLVAHVCKDERVSSHFSSILILNEDDCLRIADNRSPLSGRTLIVAELISEVDEKDWAKFYSYVAAMDRGSKVILISRLQSSEKFGTVKPMFLNALRYEEFSYLFKALAFGSANPAEHPRLMRIADEFAKELQSRWSILAANLFADAMRTNLNAHFWLGISARCRRCVERNFSVYGEHPKSRIERGLQIDATDLVLRPSAPLKLTWNSTNSVPPMELPRVPFRELLEVPSVRPKGGLSLLTWESRMSPYTSFDHFISTSPEDVPEDTPVSQRKRRGVPF